MSAMTDAEIIEWARANADAATEDGNAGTAARIRRLADLAEKGAEDWQPIASAPDGDVLLCRGAAVGVGHVAGNNVAWQLPGTPTHWRPLPAPPGGKR